MQVSERSSVEIEEMTLEEKVQYHDLLQWQITNDREQHSLLLQGVKEMFDRQTAPTQARLEALRTEIEEQARREHPGKRRIALPNGYKLAWKLTHKVDAVPNEAAAVRALLRRGLKSMVRVKIIYSVKREEVRNNPEKVKGLRAIRVKSYDSFSITPPPLAEQERSSR